MTLYDLGTELIKIRDIANNIEVKGIQNIMMIETIYRTCDEIINEINKIAKAKEDSENSNPTESEDTEVGEDGG